MALKSGNGIDALEGVNDKSVLEIIRGIAKLDEKEAAIAIARQPEILESMMCPDAIQVMVIKEAFWAFGHMKNPCEAAQLEAVGRVGMHVRQVKNPSEAVQITAVQQDTYALAILPNPSIMVQIAAVSIVGWAIRFVENPCEEVQLAAVMQNGLAIEYIKNPSEAVQLAAVIQNSLAIERIKKPAKCVNDCLAAASRSENVKIALKRMTPKIQKKPAALKTPPKIAL